MSWVTRSRLKKSKHINISNTKTRVYLPNLTKGAKWKNSDCIVTITQLNPSNRVLSCKPIITKIDDNNFDIELKTYKYQGQKVVRPNSKSQYIGDVDYIILDVYLYDYGSGQIWDGNFGGGSVDVFINNKKIGSVNYNFDYNDLEVGWEAVDNMSDGLAIYRHLDADGEDEDGYADVTITGVCEVYIYGKHYNTTLSIDNMYRDMYIKEIRYNALNIETSLTEKGVALFYEQN